MKVTRAASPCRRGVASDALFNLQNTARDSEQPCFSIAEPNSAPRAQQDSKRQGLRCFLFQFCLSIAVTASHAVARAWIR